MKTRFFTAALFALVSLFMLTSCGGSGSTSTGDSGTGSLALQIKWPSPAAKTTAKALYKAPDGVVNIRVTVSAVDIASSIIRTFSATPGVDGNGTVDKIPVGIDRKITVWGMDAGGVVRYQGSISGITVQLVANQPITIPLTTPLTTASPASGATVLATDSIVLTANVPATIYYTTNGSTPTALSPSAPSPVTITPPWPTIMFFAKDSGFAEEQVKTATYTVTP